MARDPKPTPAQQQVVDAAKAGNPAAREQLERAAKVEGGPFQEGAQDALEEIRNQEN